jgi:aerobic carbon-monoxide dehydrogenase large subunit
MQVRAKAIGVAARVLGVPESDVELHEGWARTISAPEQKISLGALAGHANPLRGAVIPGTEPGLEATAYFGPDHGSTASGVHAMVVEVDPETAMVKIHRYIVVHDCGKLINPVIVAGQVQGGVAQGIGNAFYEQLHYDEGGQLQNASFMDYLIPTALDVPRVEMAHRETEAPLNPLGIKGVGEAGCIPTGAAFAQALEDALPHLGLEIREIPLSPNRLFELMREAEGRGSASRESRVASRES